MGLTVILAALHLFPSSLTRDRPQDPENPPPVIEQNDQPPDDDQIVEDDEDELDEEDEVNDFPVSSGRRRLQRFGSAASRTIFNARFPRSLTWESVVPKAPWFTRIKSIIFPSDDDSSLEKFIPNYRWTPILAGVVIPFSILLEVPGLTEHWYIRTEENTIIETRSNSVILDVALAFSMTCALCANICLILRFLEKRVKAVTLLTIFFLTIHDLINIICVTTFGVEHRFDDGFTYGQSFWLTVCSTAVSTVTNVTLILDYVRTPAFAQSGSGLTRKQRALMIIVIVLLVYIAFGALINTLMLDLNFIDGLYFTVVTIETIGFGDIRPDSTGSRIFTCFYTVVGVINLGLAVALTRETVLEGLELGYRKRLRNLRIRRREARRFRRWDARWRRAVMWRLKEMGQPVWVSDDQLAKEDVRFVGLTGTKAGGHSHHLGSWIATFKLKPRSTGQGSHVLPPGKHLNIDALSPQQLEAAALEAGVPLEMFVRSCNKQRSGDGRRSRSNSTDSRLEAARAREAAYGPTVGVWPSYSQTPTHAQIGRMAAMVTRFAISVAASQGGSADPSQVSEERRDNVKESPDPQGDNLVQGINTPNAGHPHYVEPANILAERQRATKFDLPGSPMSSIASRWSQEWARGKRQSAAAVNEQLEKDMAAEERKAHTMKMVLAWALFFIFWTVGAAIFCTTEKWTYGIALYFCVIAFMTVGYGDYSPQSPAGRSIFVVWALLGVATVTILISVIEEAGSKRYKKALHSKSFDTAIKKYRKRENELLSKLAHYQRPQQQASHSSASLDAAVETANASAQQELESLPNHVLRQARVVHDHMHYFVNKSHMIERDGKNMYIPEELKELLDEISQLEDIGGRAKRDILEDNESRNTLLMLSVERTLRTLIASAERALTALEERDNLADAQRAAQLRSPKSRSRSPRTQSPSPLVYSPRTQSPSPSRPHSPPHAKTDDSSTEVRGRDFAIHSLLTP